MDVQDRLASHLDQQRLQLPPAGAGAEAVMQRGRRYRRNRQIAGALGMLAIVLAAVGGAVLLRANAPEAEIFAEEGPFDTRPPAEQLTPSRAATAAAAGLDWDVATASLGYTERLFAGDGTFYALSTAPGVSWDDPGVEPPLPKALWYSTNGLDWKHTMLSEDLWSSSELAFRDGLLYLLGTAPAPASPSGDGTVTRIAVSDTQGATWESQVLPTAARPPEDLGDVSWISRSREMAAGDAGVVVAVHTSYHVDYQQLVPAEVLGDMREVEPTETGVVVWDYRALLEAEERCAQATERRAADLGTEAEVEKACAALHDLEAATVTTTADTVVKSDQRLLREKVYEATWEELGIADPQLNVAEWHVSSDGRTFEQVPWPFPGASRIIGIEAFAGGFLAVAGPNTLEAGPPPVQLWRSADGRTWTPLPAIESVLNVAGFGEIAGRLVVIGGRSNQALMFVYDEASASWSETDLTSLLPPYEGFQENWVGWADVDASGVALAVSSYRGQLAPPGEGPEPPAGDHAEEQIIDGSVTNYVLTTLDLESWTLDDLNDVVSVADGYVASLAVGEGRALVRFVGPHLANNEPDNRQLMATLSG